VAKKSRIALSRLVGLTVLVIAAACGGPTQSGLSSQAGPSPIVLKDTSPGQIHLAVNVSLGGYDPSTRDTATVGINFTAQNRPVKFVGGEGVTCNGIALKPFLGSFEGTFPIDGVSGKVMKCRYTSGRQFAPVTFHVPKRLVILTPHEGEAVRLGLATTVTYESDPAVPPTVVAIGTKAKASAGPGGVSPAAASSTRATLDTRALGTGSGSIAMTQQVDITGIQAPAFRSVGGHAQLMTLIAVTWR
jgi:hypothetical protein